ncbi:hypothetical protein GALL_229370 [mine drainage metagenome]|uniref:Uncharacterized protein n=1 Tax=mine drainage metagenome TaxID=410659 RepID=A0A1J5RH82_9ZZZZ
MSEPEIHCLQDALAALDQATEQPVRLVSAPYAARALGIGGFLALVAAARAARPGSACLGVIDCGSHPGLALAAVRLGADIIRLAAAPEILDKVRQIAAQRGIPVEAPPVPQQGSPP